MQNFRGVDHAGIGVANMDEALVFWRDKLGFTELYFDYTGPVPGLEEICKKKDVKARMSCSAIAIQLDLGQEKLN